MKRHAYNTPEQPPLCGQKDRHGKQYLPTSQTTQDPTRVTCARCFALMSAAVTREHEASRNCWCSPVPEFVDPATGVTILVHRQVQ